MKCNVWPVYVSKRDVRQSFSLEQCGFIHSKALWDCEPIPRRAGERIAQRIDKDPVYIGGGWFEVEIR